MPEILTKYPEVVITVLKSGGAKCNVGVKQQILTRCPPDHFCALPSGEICVYDLKTIAQMTQINPSDFNNTPSIYSSLNFVLVVGSCLLGIFIGKLLKH